MGDDPMRSLWLGTEGGAMLHSCAAKSECEDLAIRFAMAHLIHPQGVNNGAVVMPCCQSNPDHPCQRALRGTVDDRMAAVLDYSLAELEGRRDDAVWAAVRIASAPRRCPLP